MTLTDLENLFEADCDLLFTDAFWRPPDCHHECLATSSRTANAEKSEQDAGCADHGMSAVSL